jgi:biopolymer transport protein ExbD
MKDEVFSGLVALPPERFQEMDSDITVKLADSDTEYAALKVRLDELERQLPFIEKVLEGKDELHLTAEQHAGFAEYMRVTNEAENIERMNLYLAGHRDCFAYLKRIGCSDDGREQVKSR